MKKIPLNSKKFPHLFALVDEMDFDRANNHRWYVLDSNKNGRLFYAVTRVKDRIILLHRFLLGINHGEKTQYDHKNGNGLDCRRNNLRLATKTENARNRRFTINKTGYQGVYRVGNKFQASIRINGRNKSLGYFRKPAIAALIRDLTARCLWGEFDPNHFYRSP